MKTITITKEVEIPSAVFAEVAELLLEGELSNRITAADKEEDTITLEVSYTKAERQAMHDIEDLINDHADEDEDEEDDDE